MLKPFRAGLSKRVVFIFASFKCCANNFGQASLALAPVQMVYESPNGKYTICFVVCTLKEANNMPSVVKILYLKNYVLKHILSILIALS